MLTFNSNTREIVITRGDGGVQNGLLVTVRNSAGALLNVSAASHRFTVKESIDDVIADAIFQLTNPAASGIDLTSAASGLVTVVFPPTYIEAMAGGYVYDYQITFADGSVATPLSPNGRACRFTVPKNVTTPGSVTAPTLPIHPFTGSVAIGGALYQQDQVTGMWFKSYYSNGAYLTDGPNATIPF